MLYFLFGKNTEKVRIKFSELQNDFLEKTGGFPVVRIDVENFSENYAREIFKRESLFSAPELIVGRNLLADQITGKFFLENMDLLEKSSNIFLFWEEEVSAKVLRLAEKYAVRHWNMLTKEKTGPAGKKQRKNPVLFSIADALALRQREKTWLLFQEQLMAGVPADDIFWVIVWQFKILLTVSKKERTGLHPFVFQKAERAIKFFGEGELENCSAGLVDIYHKSKIGGDLAAELEKFILRV